MHGSIVRGGKGVAQSGQVVRAIYLAGIIAAGVLGMLHLGRSIDYLESRADIDTEKLAYFGRSMGGVLGPILLAVEPRLKVGVLYNGGLLFYRQRPEADAFHYVPRVSVPVLMLNGRYDHFFPPETAQIPMYRLLGTPAA